MCGLHGYIFGDIVWILELSVLGSLGSQACAPVPQKEPGILKPSNPQVLNSKYPSEFKTLKNAFRLEPLNP